MKDKTIKFSKSRDFSETLSDTFNFIKYEFKPLFKLILTYIGPFLLITAFFGAWYQAKLLDFRTLASANNLESMLDIYSNFFSYKYFLVIIGSIVSTILMTLSVPAYVKVYKESGKDNFQSVDVWNIIKQKFFPVLGGYFLVSFLFILLLAIIFATMMLGKVLFAIMIFLYILFVMYMSISLILFVNAYVFEDISIIDSIKRSIFLIQNYWWFTLGTIIVSSLIASVGQYIFLMPSMIISGIRIITEASGNEVSGFSSILFTIFTVIGTFGSYLLYVIPLTTVTMHYHSQVEKKENPNLISKIEEIK